MPERREVGAMGRRYRSPGPTPAVHPGSPADSAISDLGHWAPVFLNVCSILSFDNRPYR
jgi:hypothetical protein